MELRIFGEQTCTSRSVANTVFLTRTNLRGSRPLRMTNVIHRNINPAVTSALIEFDWLTYVTHRSIEGRRPELSRKFERMFEKPTNENGQLQEVSPCEECFLLADNDLPALFVQSSTRKRFLFTSVGQRCRWLQCFQTCVENMHPTFCRSRTTCSCSARLLSN